MHELLLYLILGTGIIYWGTFPYLALALVVSLQVHTDPVILAGIWLAIIMVRLAVFAL